MRFIGVDQIPRKRAKRTEEWLVLLKKIPKGKAWVTTEKELGVSAVSVKTIVNRYVRNGLIPKGYKVMQRTVDGKLTIYILNESK